MREAGSSDAGGSPPALAYWLTPADAAALAAVAQARLDTGDAPAALVEARRELDAAAIRARWFDPTAATSFRRIARLERQAVAARLTADERDALLACDPALVEPLLDPSRLGVTLRAVGTDTEAPEPITLPNLPGGPVLVLADHEREHVGWALGELAAGALRTTRPHPTDPAWSRAHDESRKQHIDVDLDTDRGARRLIVPSLPALSTLALARPEFQPGPGEAVLLHLPFVVAITTAALAARVVAYASPVDVRLVADNAVPAVPGHRADVTL
jgi:hypothetical protein